MTDYILDYVLGHWFFFVCKNKTKGLRVHILVSKGQIKSKEAWACCRFSQKRMNKFVLFAVKSKKLYTRKPLQQIFLPVIFLQSKEGIQELGKKYIWQFMNLLLGHNQQLILATYKFWIYSQKTFLTTLAHSIPRLFCQKAFIDIFCH